MRTRTMAQPPLGQGPKLTPYTINRWKRFWAVWDAAGALVCLTVYRCGAEEVVRRLTTPA